MFCGNCGKYISDEEKFCCFCGAPAARNVDPQQRRAQLREEELAETERMIRYFSLKDEQYAEYDAYGSYLKKYARGCHRTLLIWGIIAVVLGLVIFSEFLKYEVTYQGVLISLAAAFPGAGMIIGYVFYARSFNENIAAAKSRHGQLAAELSAHYAGYGACRVGIAFTHPERLRELRAVIESGRADTIADACTLLQSSQAPYRRR